MRKIYYFCIVLVAVSCFSCGGGGGGSKQVNVSWDANREESVNKAGGGYILYYSQESSFSTSSAQSLDVPYVSGSLAPTTATLTLASGAWYLRIAAYGLWNGAVKYSDPSSQIALNVGE